LTAPTLLETPDYNNYRIHRSKLTIFLRIAALSIAMVTKKPVPNKDTGRCPTCGAGPGEKNSVRTPLNSRIVTDANAAD
jgi:hypothetical protein